MKRVNLTHFVIHLHWEKTKHHISAGMRKKPEQIAANDKLKIIVFSSNKNVNNNKQKHNNLPTL